MWNKMLKARQRFPDIEQRLLKEIFCLLLIIGVCPANPEQPVLIGFDGLNEQLFRICCITFLILYY
jgi:hypothetical protein